MAGQAEVEAMRRAVQLAQRGAATASPNPVVGCVVLDPDGRTVGEGWHERPGGPHAEVAALRAAGAAARGATAVVTLEPCRHTGRTGPCTRALLEAGIARVVYAVADPSAVAGGGAEQLRAAGVAVEGGVLAEEAEAGNARWLTAARLGRPQIVWKYAATLDGRSAAADGTSRWITSPQARADVHALRADVDAVVAGVGTVLADDPQLTVRAPDGTPAARQPLRVVVDTAGRTPTGSCVLDDTAPTWVATAAELGVGPDGHVDLQALARGLYARGVLRALVEGGPTLAGALLRAGLVDRVVGYVAPALLGAGAPALAEAGVATIADAYRLELLDVRRVGPDVRLEAVPRARGARQDEAEE
ncbi:bifunctional diaminohydroxyphosphoribosylaminopyrimidine deaminase/5-amino-6-(5-phosphoribosylamino)uracil reductase RibD [Motilibacter deserti]|uniref:Riboflavin biosynthesis protein RibD n=1 Tax=Motilibacter deserti TaxID=2714956 RepID=A0ABX0GXT2_9ACTN|nr:bifunctional diaminohydroxyphosphoribosylaminopyrimidine deaminase/5-amino-6-(5-phosphoribosylamino)uracil reductase RibD [Motilibacter deserti]NHC14043.1 bifunctional diaminohydroxyphosphoribosylaminopyrimidine deaminase/5-amino-6-(5-phosphoribosylamino)uracil reductase RibD [Motilibacter deserti]